MFKVDCKFSQDSKHENADSAQNTSRAHCRLRRLEEHYCLGDYQNKTKQQQKDILPLLAVGKQYSFTLVNFKDPVIY